MKKEDSEKVATASTESHAADEPKAVSPQGRSSDLFDTNDLFDRADLFDRGKPDVDHNAAQPGVPNRNAVNDAVTPPGPRDREAFQRWLETKPREWSVVIAARAALRVMPLLRETQFGVYQFPANLLPMLRATAIARFAAVHPTRTIEVAAAYAAVRAAGDARATVAEAAAYAAYAATYAAIRAAARAAEAAAATSTVATAIQQDAKVLSNGTPPAHLAREPLWPRSQDGQKFSPGQVGGAWIGLRRDLQRIGKYWRVWVNWYDEVLTPHSPPRSEAWEAAFTDVQHPSYPWQGTLPWDDGPEAVNLAIKTRLDKLQAAEGSNESEPDTQRPATIAELADAASPQPSITPDGKLDAGPNPKFDIPLADHDLPSLPIRQSTLIAVILSDLPLNAPLHLRSCLSSYDNELKARGVQPILGLLKDMADIIEAAVRAPHAEDEWLEAGLRMAFTRFAANHALFLDHFPLDPKREELYQRTPVDEEAVDERTVTKPLENVAEAAEAANRAGSATDDFVVVIDKFIELWQVVATLPQPASTSQPLDRDPLREAPEVSIRPGDRIQPITTKKRLILSALGFFERTYNLIGSTVTIIGGAEVIGTLASALQHAIEALTKLLM